MKTPVWLKKRVPKSSAQKDIRDIIKDPHIHTVCEEALCPNRGECFEKGTVTFLIMGPKCTRNCKFCNIEKFQEAQEVSPPTPLNPEEPQKIASYCQKLGIKHVVITSVTRDDIGDGGASQFVKVINGVRGQNPQTIIEVLVPDFKGQKKALQSVFKANPDVFNHNIETTPRLYPEVRPEANYELSLEILAYASKNGLITKSGFMVGMGENFAEICQILKDLKGTGTNIVTIGQYITPSKNHYPVKEYIKPEIFKKYEKIGSDLGLHVFAGPFVRSSYCASEVYNNLGHRSSVGRAAHS